MNVTNLFNYVMLLQLLVQPSQASSFCRLVSLGFIPTSMSAKTSSSLPHKAEKLQNQEAEQQQTKTNTQAKTIYLLRHAESEENVLYNSARRARHSVTRLRFPSLKDAATTLTLPFQIFRPSVTNAPPSKQGRLQIAALHKQFADMIRTNKSNDSFSFFKNKDDTMVIAHSPLKRAQQTCYGMIQEGYNFDTLVLSATPPNTIVEELGLLQEINPREMIVSGNKALDKRITELEAWIESRPEKHIVLVGHSLYFQRLLHLQQQPFENCDMWKVKYDYEIRDKLNLAKEPVEIGVMEYVMDGEEEQEPPTEDKVDTSKPVGGSRLPGAWRDLERVYAGKSPETTGIHSTPA